MSVTMEDKVEKKKGRRVTKNSSGFIITRSAETSLEKALRKSQKEQRRQEKRKYKEDKELEERVLELSKRDMGRIESASLSSFAPRLDLVGKCRRKRKA